MTIIYNLGKIHNVKDSLIVVPTTTEGLIRNTAIDDFILHNFHGMEHPITKNVHLGAVSYVKDPTNGNTFAFCYCGHNHADYDEGIIKFCLKSIKDYALENDLINDITIDLTSFVVRPGGVFIIKYLHEIFPHYTTTIYVGFPHLPPQHYASLLKATKLRNFVLGGMK